MCDKIQVEFGSPAIVKVGDYIQLQRAFSGHDVLNFANLTGDTNPIHLDEGAGANSRFVSTILLDFFTYFTYQTVGCGLQVRSSLSRFPSKRFSIVSHKYLFVVLGNVLSMEC